MGKFKVGDRVISNDNDTRGERGVVIKDDFYCGITMVKFDTWRHGHDGVNLLGDCGKDHWLVNNEDLLPATPATLTIEAGKFYKTRDGRKVGPLRSSGNLFWPLKTIAGMTTFYYREDGHSCPGSARLHRDADDLIAEWVDEPAAPVAASNDNKTPAKFKVGDVVRAVESSIHSVKKGTLYTVTSTEEEGRIRFRKDDGSEDGWQSKFFELVTPATPAPSNPAIVALIENGVPKPADRPFVHADEGAASKEASRLANKHKGQQFGVYVLTQTVSVEQTITYAHEWQRLAAKGEKILAIKALRSLTGLGLKATKGAVEHWVANDEPYARIAA